jgi:hypothetical protein
MQTMTKRAPTTKNDKGVIEAFHFNFILVESVKIYNFYFALASSSALLARSISSCANAF